MAACEDCKKGSTLPGEPKGTIVKEFNSAYFSPAPAGGESKRAVVLLTDIFGLPLANSKILSDYFAEKLSCDVWAPDFFNGRPPITPEELEPHLPDRAGVKMGFMTYVRLVGAIIPNIGGMISNRSSVVDARVVDFIKKIKEEKKYEKIGAVGYCFGGAIAVRIASTTIVDSVVIAHPGGITDAQVKAIKVPAAWACAEDDMGFKAAARKSAEDCFKAKEGKEDFVPYEFRDYKGTAHGFAARPNLEIPEVKEGFEGARDFTVEWFQKTLVV